MTILVSHTRHLRWRKVLLLASVFCLLASFIQSQNVFIKGTGPAYPSQKISVCEYDDYLTMTEKQLDADTIDKEGNFEFNLNTNGTKYVFLKMGLQKASLYIEPNRSYDVFFPPLDSSKIVNPTMGNDASLVIHASDTTDINYLIIDFNERFHKFWDENHQYFVLKWSKNKLDSFKLEVKNQYKNVKHPYFKQHLGYFFASIETSTLQDKLSIANRYLYKRPVLYQHKQYMEFFNMYFKDYVYQFAATKAGEGIFLNININPSYIELMKILAAKKLLNNDTLREFVLLKGLTEFYNDPNFSRPGVVAVVGQIASTGLTSYHRRIAQNLLNTYSKLQPGTRAPGFSLIDRKGKMVNLSDFKGKYVYLGFFETWCTTCMQEVKMLQEFKKKYSSKVVFVTICTDKDTATYNAFLKQNPKYDWTILYGGDNAKVKDDYNLKSVPLFFFINPDGQLHHSPADNPSGGIEAIFYTLTHRGKPKKFPWERKDE